MQNKVIAEKSEEVDRKLSNIISDISPKTEILDESGGRVIFEKSGNSVLVYVYKTPYIPSGEEVFIGETTFISNTKNIIFVGELNTYFVCFLKANENGEVYLANYNDRDIENLYYKGSAILM